MLVLKISFARRNRHANVNDKKIQELSSCWDWRPFQRKVGRKLGDCCALFRGVEQFRYRYLRWLQILFRNGKLVRMGKEFRIGHFAFRNGVLVSVMQIGFTQWKLRSVLEIYATVLLPLLSYYVSIGSRPISVFSERELLSPVRLSSVVWVSVTFVHPTQPVEIFGNISTAFSTLVIHWHPRRSFQGNPFVGGVKRNQI